MELGDGRNLSDQPAEQHGFGEQSGGRPGDGWRHQPARLQPVHGLRQVFTAGESPRGRDVGCVLGTLTSR